MLSTPVTLEGQHVRLEPLSLEHADALIEVGLDPDLWRVTNVRVETPDQMRDYVRTALANRENGTDLPFATVERSSGRPIGCTRFLNIERAHKRAEIGSTWIAPAWQRTPINTEAKYLMLRYAFEEAGLLRVEFKTDMLNEKSRTAILRIGAKQEGIFRKHMTVYGGRVRDTVWFSIINEEWPEVKQGLEQKLMRGRMGA